LYGTPERGSGFVVNSQMVDFYGVPTFGAGVTTDAKCIDTQAGLETMGTAMICALEGDESNPQLWDHRRHTALEYNSTAGMGDWMAVFLDTLYNDGKTPHTDDYLLRAYYVTPTNTTDFELISIAPLFQAATYSGVSSISLRSPGRSPPKDSKHAKRRRDARECCQWWSFHRLSKFLTS
jgi:hypothetical protein